jgi:hypothetical protein
VSWARLAGDSSGTARPTAEASTNKYRRAFGPSGQVVKAEDVDEHRDQDQDHPHKEMNIGASYCQDLWIKIF